MTEHLVDFPESSIQIAFVYKDIGTDRDIPYVFWNNREWMQVVYDYFREEWSDSRPILYGGCEAIRTRFNLPPEADLRTIAVTPPEKLRSPGNGESTQETIYPETVTRFSRWYDHETKTEHMAERFSSGNWCLAKLDKESYRWNILGLSFSDEDILSRYREHSPKISFLGGIPPE